MRNAFGYKQEFKKKNYRSMEHSSQPQAKRGCVMCIEAINLIYYLAVLLLAGSLTYARHDANYLWLLLLLLGSCREPKETP